MLDFVAVGGYNLTLFCFLGFDVLDIELIAVSCANLTLNRVEFQQS